MFKYQTIFILLLVLGAATCFIAYLSDQLGMKLGKKRISLQWNLKLGKRRVSLLNLRPRQTATALSMASSLAVMIVTMLVLLAINPSLRKGLLYYDEAKRENARLGNLNAQLKSASQQQQSAIAEQTKTNRVLETSLQGKNAQLTGLNARVAQTKSQVNAAQGRLNAAQKSLDDAQRNLRNAQAEREAAQRARDLAQAAQNRAQSGETQARQGESTARARFQTAQSNLKKAQQQEKIAQQGIVQASAKLKIANANLERVNSQLSSNQFQLTNAQKNLGVATARTLGALQKTAQTYQKLSKLNVQVEQQKALLAQYEEELRGASKTLSVVKGILSGDIAIAVPAGQVFSEATIPAPASAAQVQVVLRKLLAQANENAKQVNFQAVNLDLSSFEQNDQSTLSDQQQLELAAQVYAAQAPISIRIVASRDHPVEETQLSVRPVGVLIRAAFQAGETLAQTTIEGSQLGATGDAQIFNRLLALLDEGQKLVKARKVTPIPTADEPNIYASDTRVRVFEALRQIQQSRGKVAVRVVTAVSVSTIEPVHVRIEVGDAALDKA